MAKDNRLLAIDVGGDSLKMAEFSFASDGGITLDKFAFRRIDVPQDTGEAPDFAGLYHEMLISHGFTARQVRLSLPAQSSFLKLSKLPPTLGSQKAIGRIVEFEARQSVPYSMDEVEWAYQLMRHAWEEKHVETQEDGSSLEVNESHEEFEALFVAVKTENITEYTDVIGDSGKEVLSVNIAPIPLFNAAKVTQMKNDECVLLLNIGHRSSSLIISDHSRVFLRSIPIAGYAITLQVAKEFGIQPEEAEALKKRHGFVALGGAYEEPESELAATISKIARNVMTRLHGEVSRSINVWRSQHGGNQPTRMLLAGGGATMMYMPDFFNEKLRIPVDYLNTFSAITIGPEVDRTELQAVAPMFQELIGMSIRHVANCPLEITLLPRSIRKQRELNRRKPYFYASAGVLVVCLSIFAFGVSMMLSFQRQRVDRVKQAVGQTDAKRQEISQLTGSLGSTKGAFDETMRLFGERNVWTDVIAELQSMMPDTMWLLTLEGVGDPQEPGRDNPEGGAPVGADPGSMTEQQRFIAAADLTEIKRLHVRGCTLVLKNRTLQEEELRAKIAKSKYFSSAEISSLQQPNEVNLTGFDMYLVLKTPIKK
jgi:type IV pilus assembly protein PilM